MNHSTSSLESTRQRLTTFSLLYLSEGIPSGFTAIALATYLRMQGAGLVEVGAVVAALYAPWAFKWAWAPLVDIIQIKRFGPYRAWIAASQLLMILTLGAIIFLDVTRNLKLLTMLVIVHNIFAATQDIAIDALAVRVLPEKERGIANGLMFGAAYLGQTIGGSGALLIAGTFGFKATIPFVLAILILIFLMVTLRIREPEAAVEARHPQLSHMAQVIGRLKSFGTELYQGFFGSGIGPKVGVVFSLLPSGTLALGLALASTMQVDIGMNESQIAMLTMLTTVLSAIGCVIGGWISDRVGHRKALGVWYILTIIPAFYLASQFIGVQGMEGVTLREFYIAALAYSFPNGLIQGTNKAVFMDLTNPAVAGTQFTGYMALSNLVYTYTNLWQAGLAASHGYGTTLYLDGILVILPLMLIPLLKPSSRAYRRNSSSAAKAD